MMRNMVLNWISIRDLFAREWFSRWWIFQEIGLASSAVMVIGVNELKWEEVSSYCCMVVQSCGCWFHVRNHT